MLFPSAVLEEDSRDCEAALNLLSMAAGQPKQALDLFCLGGRVKVETDFDPSMESGIDILSIVQGDALQKLLPLLNPEQLAQLKTLCELFDTSYKELVAAHAARDAVAKILAAKQEETRAAFVNARRSAEELLFENSVLCCAEHGGAPH